MRRARMEMKAIATNAMRWSLRALEDDVQPPVAAQPSEGALNHPADAGWNEPSVVAADNCLDGDAERSRTAVRSPAIAATETNTPDRHNDLAQRRPNQRRLWPRSHRSGTILCHGLEFRQHFVHEHVNIGKRIPRCRRRLFRPDGGSHVLVSMLKTKGNPIECSPFQAPLQFYQWL
jgi:hypothetical protein